MTLIRTWLLFQLDKLLFRLRRWLSPHGVALDMITAYRKSALLACAARVGVPTALAGGPRRVAELSAALGADRTNLSRLLRALTALGVTEDLGDGRYRLTTLGRFLLQEHPDTLHGNALYFGELSYRAYEGLSLAITRGEVPFTAVYGESFYEYLKKHEEMVSHYNRAVAIPLQAKLLASQIPFAGVSRAVDLGGGRGDLLLAVLRRHPAVQGVLFEIAPVLEEAQGFLDGQAEASRITTVPGSFFESIPEGGDLYLLVRVLLNWDDNAARVLLRNCARAVPAGKKLVVIEPLATTRVKVGDDTALADINLWAHLGGKMRTAAELDALLAEAGFAPLRKQKLRGTFLTICTYQP
jgi:SAM-dependent methyltransferase